MPKTKISEFSATPANNTDIDSINIAEGCAPSGINDAIRELMAQLKDFQTGAVGDSFNGPVGTSTAAAGAFTTLSASSTATLNTLVSSGATLTGGSINGMAIGGTTAAAGAFTTLAASGNVTLSGGTANGVAYLNASKVVTSGSALTFDGSALGVSATVASATLASSGSYSALFFTNSGGATKTGTILTNSSGILQSRAETSAWTNYDASSEYMRLTSTGLGIGTSSPTQKLDVAGQVTISSGNGYLWGNGAVQIYSNSSYLRFRTASTDRLEIDSSGNLGLGVTPSAWNSTLKAIQFGSGVLYSVASTNDATFGSNSYIDSGGTTKYLNSSFATLARQTSGQHIWYNAPSGTAGNAITFTQAMTLDASGNLLVGTTSPLYSTANRGNITLNGASTAILGLGIAGVATGYLYTDANVVSLGAESTRSMTFAVNGAERARIDSSGNLLVGTTSQISAEKFGVSANVANYMAIFKNAGDNANRLGIAIQCGANNASGTNYAMAFDDGDGTRQGQITFSGGTTTYGTSSDYRLKENVQPINNAIERLSLLKPCKWNWKRDGGESEGFIAHELQDIVPIAVAGEKDAMDENGKPIYQSVGAANIVPLLTKALQEALAEINQLKARLDAANL